MLYPFLKSVFRFSLGQFFQEIRVRGADRVEQGPVIIVSNHPNFMLDSLLVGQSYQRPLWFLAKATLFNIPLLRFILKHSHVIPVYRRQDNPEELGKNEQTFSAVVDHLLSHKGVVIFPEGVSTGERRLSNLKTGAARMAFQAEAAAQFQLNLKIQAVGLTYSALQSFRSSVTIRMAEPLEVRLFEQAYRSDAVAAVKDLTSELENRLQQVTVEVKDAEHEALVEKITAIYASRASGLDDFERMKLIATNVELVTASRPELRHELEQKIDQYLDLAKVFTVAGQDRLDITFSSRFAALVTLPVLIGVLIHLLPYRYISWRAAGKNLTPVEIASKKFATGLYSFPLWYLFLSGIIGFWLKSISAAGLCMPILIYLGYLTNRYLAEVRVYLLSVLWPGHKKPAEVLKSFRDELIAELEKLRVA